MVYLLIALYQLVRWIFGSIIWGFVSFVVRLCLSKLGGQIGQNILDRLSNMTENIDAASSTSSSSSTSNVVAEDRDSATQIAGKQERMSAIRQREEAQRQVKYDLQQLVPAFVTRANLSYLWEICKIVWIGYFVVIVYYAFSSQESFCNRARERYRRADRNSVDYLAARQDVTDCNSSSAIWRAGIYVIVHFDLIGGPFPILTKIIVPLAKMLLPGRTMGIITICVTALGAFGYGAWILTSAGRRELVTSIVRTKYTEMLWALHGWLGSTLKTKKKM